MVHSRRIIFFFFTIYTLLSARYSVFNAPIIVIKKKNKNIYFYSTDHI